MRACARPFGRVRQGTWCFRLPLTPPSSYPGALPAPGAGLPSASSRVSTACYRTPFSLQAVEFVGRREQFFAAHVAGGAGSRRRGSPRRVGCSIGGRGRSPAGRGARLEQGSVEPLVHLRVRAQGQVPRMETDEPIGGPPGHRPHSSTRDRRRAPRRGQSGPGSGPGCGGRRGRTGRLRPRTRATGAPRSGHGGRGPRGRPTQSPS